MNNGKNSLYHLCEELENYCKEILLNRETKRFKKLTKHQKQKHEETKQCSYCKKVFVTDKEDKSYVKF